MLSYQWFNQQSTSFLTNKVIYFNSCKTYNNPLWSSIMTHQARTYIASDENLPVGASEKITTEFWNQVLNDKAKMLATMNQLNINSLGVKFKLAGDGGPFVNS